MAFSFNWAGLDVPTINVHDSSEQVRTDMQNLGGAVRGYQVRQADKEYADLLGQQEKLGSDIESITSEIATLEARNKEILQELSTLG